MGRRLTVDDVRHSHTQLPLVGTYAEQWYRVRNAVVRYSEYTRLVHCETCVSSLRFSDSTCRHERVVIAYIQQQDARQDARQDAQHTHPSMATE